MRINRNWITLCVLISASAVVTAADKSKAGNSGSAPGSTKTAGEHWEIAGDLSEACTCTVPCTCNFGEGPSPHHYCYSLYAVDIQKGHYGSVSLDGLHLARAHGKKSDVWYIDNRATPAQAEALKSIAGHISNRKSYFASAHIAQEVGEKGNRLQVGDKGDFEADYILGGDKKTPIVVENNTAWNIPRAIKGKTKRLRYKDRYGNRFDVTRTNSNQGKVDWTDQSSFY